MTATRASDEGRHRCEVRQLIARRVERGRAWLRWELGEIERVRGKAAQARLEADIAAQWAAGNRGAWGDWREPDVAQTAQRSRMGHHGD